MKSFNPVGTLVVLSLLEGFSFFGRTSALSPFLPSLCSDLSLSMTQISSAYMLANLIAGLLLPFVGKYYHRTGLLYFIKAFVKFFAFPFVFIGIFGSLKSLNTLSRGGSSIPILLLVLTGLPPVTTVFLKNRRSRFWVLVAGTCIMHAFMLIYLAVMKVDNFSFLMILGVTSCFAQLLCIIHYCGGERYFPLFFNSFLASLNICISGFFLGWVYATGVCIFLIFLVIIGFVYRKNKQIGLVLGIMCCLCIDRLTGGYVLTVFCLCLLLLRLLFKYRNFSDNVAYCFYIHRTGFYRAERVAVMFPFAFLLLLGTNHCPIWIAFSILTCAFVCIRIAVQAYTLAGRSWLATHFPERRGFATGCVQLCVTMITASTPVICYQISQYWTWEVFFYALGGIWLIFKFICPFFLPTNKPSKTLKTEAPMQSSVAGRGLFVFIWLMLFFRNAQNSGIAFHLVPMCRDFGVNAKMVSATFIPISLLAVGMTFLFGHYFKRLGSQMSLELFLLSDAGMLYAVKHIDASGMLWLFIACTGIYWGINNIIASMIIPALFGTNRIGALNGLAFGAVSLGSAFGPFFFSIMKDMTSYRSALTMCINGVVLLLCLFVLLKNQIKFSETDAWNP